jgi:hypothetical protein
MTATTTDPTPEFSAIVTTDQDSQLADLKARYPKVREPILVALHILAQNPGVGIDDAKAQAALRGVRITAASLNAAQRLLSRQDGAPAVAATPARARRNGAVAATKPQPRRPRAAKPDLNAEALIRGVVSKIQDQGNAETERLRDAMRKAIAVLEAAART